MTSPLRPALVCLLVCFHLSNSQPAPAATHVCFTPGEHCQLQLVAAIDNARSQIQVQAYLINAPALYLALIRAKQRGLAVTVILDKSYRTLSPAALTNLQSAAVKVMIDSQHAISHNKVIIIDSKLLITGSYNLTTAAEERNAENLLFIDEPAVVAAYAANFQKHLAHSAPPSVVLPHFPVQHFPF